MSRLPDVKSVANGVAKRVLASYQLDDAEHVESVTNDLVNDFEVTYHIQDDFTVALMTSKDPRRENNVNVVGVSKRNPEDGKNSLRGHALALSRAMRKAVEFYVSA